MSTRILSRILFKNPYFTWLALYSVDKNLLRYRDDKKYIKGKLIDIGCGSKPYKSFWSTVVTEHVGVDHTETLHDKSTIDRWGSAYQLPAENNEFDSAICNSVLEHLEEPDNAIKECYRVLKPEAIAIFSVPFIWQLHEEPRDFYRFSKYGLKYLFEKNGFKILESEELSGFWGTAGQMFVYYLNRFRRGGKINPLWWIIPPFAIILLIIFYFLDYVDHPKQWTWGNIIVVQKSGKNNG